MGSIFSKIIKGELPSYKVAETDNYLAFLDVFPLAKGHTLVIPKQEIDYLFDMDDELYSGLLRFAKKVAHAVDRVIPCQRIGMAVIGLEVPHAHIHLVPINTVGDINFSNPKLQPAKEELESTAKKISEAFLSLNI